LKQGGIYLYRNCGEGGTVRIETPSYNRILNNLFVYQRQELSDPAIYVGSRNYGRFENWWPGSHCNDDVGRQRNDSKRISLEQLIQIGNARRDHSNDIEANRVQR